MTDPELVDPLVVSPPLSNMDPPVSTPPSPFDPSPPSMPLQATISLKSVSSLVPEASETYIGTTTRKGKSAAAVSVEDRLMRKDREAKIRFAARKKEIEADMMREVKAAPTINPVSRKIAEQNFLMRFFPDKMQLVMQQKVAKTQMNTENFHTPSFPSPKSHTPAFLSSVHRADIHTERQESVEREKRETFVMVPRCHVSLPQSSSTKVYLPVRLGPEDNCKLVSPDYSLSAVALLRKVKKEEQAIEERIVDPLEMNAEQRSKYFLEQKQRKLHAEMEKKLADEARICTFTPSISHSPHLSESQSQYSLIDQSVALTDRSRISQTSYTDRYQRKQELLRTSTATQKKPQKKENDGFTLDANVRVPPPNSMYEATLPKAQPAPPREDATNPFYSQLSPTSHAVAFRAGCDLVALQERVRKK